MQLSTEQAACVDKAMDTANRLFAISGAAGTGKTTLITYIARQLDAANITYAVCAPTGKAAKRIRTVTNLPAVTAHKLLEYGRPGERDPKTGEPVDTTRPKRDRINPLGEQVILVDEYSMINHELNRNLIDALPRGGRMIMFGDKSQLPPIERYVIKNAEGSPFMEHMQRANCHFELTEVFRQVEGSDVLLAAQAVRKGTMPRRGKDFVMRMTDKPVDALRELVREAIANGIDYRAIHNQILTPVKSRWIGTHPLNIMLRGLLNPHSLNEIQLVRYSWDEKNSVSIAVGDKVVCTENTYDMRNYTERYLDWREDGSPEPNSFIPTPETKYMLNGETGVVTEIYPDNGFEVDFGDRTVEIPYSYEEWWEKKSTIIDTFPQRQIDLAYALTVHKAQGSEYEEVVYVINSSVFFMLSRENFYTAITRARKKCTLITDSRALNTSLRVTQKQLDARKATQEKKLLV